MPELELGPEPRVAGGRAMAAVTGEPLSPPHSPERRVSNNNNTGVNNNNISDNNTDKPMDLSSGGGGLGLTQLFREAELPIMGPDHPLVTARRLADLVRAQHQQSEQRERETKRKWEDRETEEEAVTSERPPEKWSQSPGPASAAVSGPGSPAGSSSGSESGQSQSGAGPGREEKRRRLDMLLNKKFDKVTSSGLDNPILMSTPPPSERETSPASDRRPSTESTGAASASVQPLLAGERKNRRKQSQPGSRPGTPPCISIRPHSDLFPPQPAATSTPRGHKTEAGARDYSPARKLSRSQSPPLPQSKSPVAKKLFNEEKENKDALRNQLLQVQVVKRLFLH